jgi:hypothetical protein
MYLRPVGRSPGKRKTQTKEKHKQRKTFIEIVGKKSKRQNIKKEVSRETCYCGNFGLEKENYPNLTSLT